jgi:hypothetical protein
MSTRNELTNQIAEALVKAFLTAPSNLVNFSFDVTVDDASIHTELGSSDLLLLVGQVVEACVEALPHKKVLVVNFDVNRNVTVQFEPNSSVAPVFKTTLAFQVLLSGK